MKRFGILLVFALLAVVQAQEVRTWTSASGKTLQAAFVERQVDLVVLQLPGGEKMKIRLNQLSGPDQIYVGSQTAPPTAPVAARSGAVAEQVPPPLADLFGKRLVDAKGKKVSTSMLADKKIGIYFSASWCPPCRAFTPKLVAAYNQLRADGKPFEVVLVCSDQDERSMEAYMKSHEMPWLAVPFGDSHAEALKKKFSVSGIPKLVVVDADGQTLSSEARGEIAAKGAGAFDGW